MNDEMSKARLLELLRTKRAEWDQAVVEVPQARMTEGGVAEHWSVKDIIVHLTFFERWYADRMQEQLTGKPYVRTELDGLSFDERNDAVYRLNRDRPLSDVLAESTRAFQDLLKTVEAHTEAFLTEPQPFEGVPHPMIVWQMLRGDVYGHYAEHISSIKDWLVVRQNDR